MEANELMIGDWVQISEPCKYHGAIGRIKTLIDHKDDETAYFKVFLRSNTIHIGIEDICSDDIKPIPLTSEILEKNKFLANTHVYPYPYYEYINEKDKLKVGFAFPQGNKTSYKEPWIYIDSEHVFIEHLPCIFVHQLQHALRLCGIEKEIIL